MKDHLFEMFPGSLTGRQVLDQLEAMRRIAAQMSFERDIVPSRLAARRLAEDLILEYSANEAERCMNDNPIGIISFLSLAKQWKIGVSGEVSELVSTRKPDERPFGELSSWFLSCLNWNEKAWLPDCAAKDNYGFSD